ncbi:MAG: hypothetical protein ABIP55_10675 [Tepidisphaeraceae bacterium]
MTRRRDADSTDADSANAADPQRPLRQAIRAARLLGFCSALFGLVVVVVLGYFNRYQSYRLSIVALGLVIWLIPGVLLMTYAALLSQRRRRAAIGAMAVTSAHALFALAALVASVMLPPVSFIPILMSLLWIALAGLLLAYLWRSLPLLEHDAERRHGFEIGLGPVKPTGPPPRPVLPVEDDAPHP